MAFSGALTLTDLNDFITPAQICIKPVEDSNKEEKQPGAAETEIQIDASGEYYEVATNPVSSNGPPGQGKKLQQAEISLSDCLACSGCITSAESVLITLQSHTEVFNFLESNSIAPAAERKVAVISIAPQSLASLAASLSTSSSVTPRQVLRRTQTFCRKVLGFDHVFDTNFARHLALMEHVSEYEERKKKTEAMGEGHLPMLASACPGWVCYAEKAHAEMLPFISQTKSPQQVMGTLVKRWMASKWGKLPNEVYHVTVMPCYDKKLEASRQDFYNDLYSTRDVDCVITTGELQRMMEEKNFDLSISVPGELDPPPSPQLNYKDVSPTPTSPVLPELLTHQGTSSGSYLHALIAHHLRSSSVPLFLSVQMVRNADYEEYLLSDGEGSVVFKGAKCYGFRNLQNIVRKVGKEAGVRVGGGAAGRLANGRGGAKGEGIKARLAARKKKKAEGKGDEGDHSASTAVVSQKDKGYDYVEVMACPGGCVNGGGQLKPPASVVGSPSTPALTSGGKDEEGYSRDWKEDGVQLEQDQTTAAEGVLQNAKWGDKEWTKKVETSYWQDLPVEQGHSKTRADVEAETADALANAVLEDICRGGESRTSLLRTQYHAVESDVIGLMVKW